MADVSLFAYGWEKWGKPKLSYSVPDSLLFPVTAANLNEGMRFNLHNNTIQVLGSVNQSANIYMEHNYILTQKRNISRW
jgi:hypothetical protein